MKRRVIAAAMLLSANVAQAQRTETDLGSHIPVPMRARIPDGTKLSEFDRGRVALAQFARCTLDRSLSGVQRAFSVADEEQQNQVLSRLLNDDCLDSGTMKFKLTGMRWALFTEMYRRRVVKAANLPPMAGYDFARSSKASDDMRVYWWMMDFADCVVSKDRTAADRYVLSSEASRAETDALRAIKPSLGPCVPAGQQFALNQSVIKGSLAEVLYRGPQRPVTQGVSK